jgi:hypothetical protein
MLNYLKKFSLEILPSVAATVIGAYIVNHYVSKPATDAPASATVAPAGAKKNIVKSGDGPTDVVSVPGPGVKAKGISERAMMEKSASERPGEFTPSEKPAEVKPAELKPAETASAPAEPRRHPAPKAVAKTTPAPAASPTTPVDTAAAAAPAEDHRDANDLAREAIERLRESQPRTQEASRTPEAPRLQEAPRTVMPSPTTASVRPLPPPITVSPPPAEAPAPAATASIRNDDPNRPTPPAEIPPPPPIDLRADANNLAARTNNMAQDMLAKTKSMFHALLPNSNGNSGNGQSSSASQFTD